MKITRFFMALLLLGTLLFLQFYPARIASAAPAVVRAVLFFSPTCPHCHFVMDEVLPPLFDRYGDQLVVANFDVGMPQGQALYRAAVTQFAIPEDRIGVPTLIIGTTVLVGSDEIPGQLPGLIETILASGGNDWPQLPGLLEALPEQSLSAEQTLAERFQQDLSGNTLAVIVLIGMVLTVMWLAYQAQRRRAIPLAPEWLIPVLCIAGLVVAGYLTYIEISETEAICGPVGNCNAVQQSPYARVFGVLPVGVLGLSGYIAMLAIWMADRTRVLPGHKVAWRLLTGCAIFGVLFSIYLTFLEPFIIGASCLWCLTSAVLITSILIASAGQTLKLEFGRQRR